jgi:N-methylhydantoinase A
MRAAIGDKLGLPDPVAAASVCEVVEENMANAARVHAMERGKDLEGRTMIAFGGAAPLHACRIAEKLNIGQVLVPAQAGVGSAVGFLVAPVSYEVVRSRHTLLDPQCFDVGSLNALCNEMRAEALQVVRAGVPNGTLTTTIAADMRYRGQGHEITVRIPDRLFNTQTCADLTHFFEEAYAAAYGRIIPGLAIEVINWTLRTSAGVPTVAKAQIEKPQRAAAIRETREMFDFQAGRPMTVSVHRRDALTVDEFITGPAVIIEDETTTVVGERFHASVGSDGSLILERANP